MSTGGGRNNTRLPQAPSNGNKIRLSFINQPEGKIQEAAVRKKIRQHAMNHHVSKSKPPGTKLALPLQVELEVPAGFGDVLNAEAGMFSGIGVSGGFFADADTSQLSASTQYHHHTGHPSSHTDHTRHLLNTSRPSAGTSLAGDNSTIRPFAEPGPGELDRGQSEEAARRKASKPKVRTGCKTCKLRRIKCDETKPACLRCLRHFGSCEGYGTRKDYADKPRIITPKGDNSQLTSYHPSFSIRFQNEMESLYFQTFKNETSTELSGIFKVSFWTQIVLQEFHGQEFVRHAVLAIGALHKSVKTAYAAISTPGQDAANFRVQAQKHRESALKQYGKALQLMRSISPLEAHDFRNVLIASLLVFAFETLCGQPDMALSQFLIGDAMICKWLLRLGIASGLTSPATHVVEDGLLSAYTQIDLQMMMFTDVRPFKTHELGKVQGSHTIANMPSEFDLTEAQPYLQLIMRRSCHFIISSLHLSKSASLQRDFLAKLPRRRIDITSGSMIYSSPYMIPKELHEERQAYLSDIQRWSLAFDSLCNQPLCGDPLASTGLTLLKLHSLSIKIAIAGTIFTEECSYDQFLPGFKEIVSLARLISAACLEYSHNGPSFRIDFGIVSPLLIVLLRCRDNNVRHEALEILQSSDYQDGPWDQVIVAKAARWIVEVEERGMLEDGYIPESERVRLSRIMISMESRRAIVQCVRRDGRLNEGGEQHLEWEERVFDLDEDLTV